MLEAPDFPSIRNRSYFNTSEKTDGLTRQRLDARASAFRYLKKVGGLTVTDLVIFVPEARLVGRAQQPNPLGPVHHETFHNIRTPIRLCRHCGGEVKDYDGHRGAMNPKGVTLTNVWDDIPPVRHWKFKTKKRRANTLSTRLLQL